MAVVLTISDLIDAGTDAVVDGRLSAQTFGALQAAIENAAGALAHVLGDLDGVRVLDTIYDADGSGLCASFVQGPDGQTSDLLFRYDTGGEWSAPAPEG